jgi:hypothetical protein
MHPKIIKFAKIAQVEKTNAAIELYERKLLTEEMIEMLGAFAEFDYIEHLDGIGDSWFLVNMLGFLGMSLDKVYNYRNALSYLCYSHGVDTILSDQALERVCDSNLTKFDTTYLEAFQTGEAYRALGVECYMVLNEEYNLIATFSRGEQTDINGKYYPHHKLLKSVTHFVEPDFSGMV